ncbi:MAG: HAMP domain-containing histidine kinase, partial [Bacteroidota bacterium]|nr:HAMP domain-containing histidine kinase [Bacteroidota bacterium]
PGVYFDPAWCPCMDSTGQGIFVQNNTYYYGIKNKLINDQNEFCYIVYSEILPDEILSDSFSITNEKVRDNQLPILDNSKSTIAYLSNQGDFLAPPFANIIIIIYLLVLYLLYIPFHYFAKQFFQAENIQWAILSLLTASLLTISLSQWIIHQHEFYHTVLSDALIKSRFFNYTLFEFIVLASVIFHLTYFFHKYYKIGILFSPQSTFDKYLIPFFNYFTVFLSLIVFCAAAKTVFVHSDFYFDLDNIIRIPFKNYLLLFSLLLILLSIFLISHKLCQSTLSFGFPLRERIGIYLVSMVFIVPVLSSLNLDINIFIFLGGASIVIWMQDYFADEYQANILWLISWLIIISFLCSGLIFHYQNIDKRYLKNELVERYKSQKQNIIDPTSGTVITPVSELIERTNQNGFELFVYERGYLKYASSIQKPSLKSFTEHTKQKTHSILTLRGKEYLVYKPNVDQVFIISHSLGSIVNAISLFSYIFTILILFAYLLSLIQQRYNFLPDGLQIKIAEKPSLRNRIQFYVILGIVISFLIIAMVTTFFTRQSEQQILEKSMVNKLKHLSTFLEGPISEQDNFENAKIILKSRLKSAYTLYDYYVEIYDESGFKIPYLTLQDAVEGKFKLCDPRFFFNYPKDIEESILLPSKEENSEKTLSVFKNIFFNNQRLATLQLTGSIDSHQGSGDRLTNLINTLLNIYVFLFLIAASLATFLANSITSPLEVLGNKLRQIRLGKRNEKLEWKAQDEIGELIQDYNRMIEQLEESANLLAKTERDMAWREMAKQVAHEIKNPLTPMKLNLQYLQQMLRSGSPDVIPMIEKVSHSMLEQIEGLTKIATEFSNFAKMPKTENEKLLLNDVISTVHDLFRKRDDIDIHLIVPIDEIYVYTDKIQLIRVLNNLINNAIQAIPEERRGRIELSLKSKEKMAVITVKDNGEGIPDEMKHKVFLPNFTTKSSGTGLGLAMCQQIVEAANGTISFQGNKDFGTTFMVELPLMKESRE